MTQPGSITNLAPVTDGDLDVQRRLRDLERQAAQDRAARTLQAATIGSGGLVVQGGNIVIKDAAGNVLLTLDGDGLTVSPGGVINVSGGNVQSGNFSAGSDGWRLQSDGSAEFNVLTLRGGIIGNDALTSPVTVDMANGSTDGLTVGTTYATLHSESISVPSGYSTALVFMVATVGATAASGGGILYGTPRINSTAGDEIAQAAVGGGAACTLPCFYSRVLTGLSGGSITADIRGKASTASWTGGNGHVSAFAVFLR